MVHPHPVLEVTGQDPDAVQDNLTAAVHAAREQAMLVGGYGIMITQHDFDSFTVAPSADVPYGQTYEQRQLRKPPVTTHAH
jgi:hypothetical protein